MINIVLFEPEIPQNTGNIARTCACCAARLHLVEPLGFRLTQKQLARSGMDYWDDVEVIKHSCTEAFLEAQCQSELWFFTGATKKIYTEVDFSDASQELYLIFGRESRGIDPTILACYQERCLRVPMKQGKRSLNLSNTVALVAYEVARQQGFAGLV